MDESTGLPHQRQSHSQDPTGRQGPTAADCWCKAGHLARTLGYLDFKGFQVFKKSSSLPAPLKAWSQLNLNCIIIILCNGIKSRYIPIINCFSCAFILSWPCDSMMSPHYSTGCPPASTSSSGTWQARSAGKNNMVLNVCITNHTQHQYMEDIDWWNTQYWV
jgi:hypothetical protein